MKTDFTEAKITNQIELANKIMQLGLSKAAVEQEFRENIKEILKKPRRRNNPII